MSVTASGFSSLIRMSTNPAKVVLLACGSFNPITNMHLRLFELARDSLNRTGRFKVIGGIISPVSDHYGKKDLLLSKHRCAMIQLALKSSDWISVDTWECEQSGWMETANVLTHHSAILNGDCNANIETGASMRKRIRTSSYFADDENNTTTHKPQSCGEKVHVKLLCGADLLESFGVPGLWKKEHIKQIVGEHGLICITRAGTNPYKFIYESDVLTEYQENICIVTEWIQNDISASKIRRALRRGQSVKYLIQESVLNYIQNHGLYGVPDNYSHQ